MKPITLHPVSVLAGLALAGVLVLGVGAAQSHGTVQSIPIHDVRLVGEIPADWWTYLELSTAPDGTLIESYSVPLDRHLVVTTWENSFGVLADGQSVTIRLRGAANGTTRVPFPPGTLLTASPGIYGAPSVTRLWGYLEPVR